MNIVIVRGKMFNIYMHRIMSMSTIYTADAEMYNDGVLVFKIGNSLVLLAFHLCALYVKNLYTLKVNVCTSFICYLCNNSLTKTHHVIISILTATCVCMPFLHALPIVFYGHAVSSRSSCDTGLE